MTRDFLKSQTSAFKFLLSIKLGTRKIEYLAIDELPERTSLIRWGKLMNLGHPIFEQRGGNRINFLTPTADQDLEEMIKGTRDKGLCVQWTVLKMYALAVCKHHSIKLPFQGAPSQS